MKLFNISAVLLIAVWIIYILLAIIAYQTNLSFGVWLLNKTISPLDLWNILFTVMGVLTALSSIRIIFSFYQKKTNNKQYKTNDYTKKPERSSNIQESLNYEQNNYNREETKDET
jgi:hypothetical protein